MRKAHQEMEQEKNARAFFDLLRVIRPERENDKRPHIRNLKRTRPICLPDAVRSKAGERKSGILLPEKGTRKK